MSVRSFRALGLALLIVSISACQSSSGNSTVSGKVTYKGQPLKNGEVHFKAADGNWVSGEIKSDGTYEAKDIPRGNLQVEIKCYNDELANEYYAWLAGRAKKEGDPIGPDGKPIPKGSRILEREEFSLIPKKYAKYETSGLTLTVNESKVTKNFDLTD
jgi:hypothetical protein